MSNNVDKRTIQFSPPDITELEIEGVVEVLRSGWITTGPKTKELEKKIANWIGTEKCACLNSQTACQEMVLRLLGIGPGDEVITCAYTYTASASVIEHIGAKIVLVDCQKDNFNIDYDAVEQAITERTKAIIPIDLGGVLCDYDRLFEIVQAKRDMFRPANKIQESIGRVAICADSAHSFGAEYHEKKCGSIADFSAFSFHAVKNFTTGEGGAITWRSIKGLDDEWMYKQFMLLSLHGQNKDALSKTKLGAWEYDIIYPAYKCNMTDIQAAIGLKQLERYESLLARRREIIEKYDANLKPLGVKVLKHFDADRKSSGHLYLMRIPNIGPEQRNEIIERLAERGIATNVHYKPLPLLTAYRNLGFNISDFPNAYNQFKNEITLPLHTKLSDEDVEYINANVKSVIKEVL